MFRTHISMWVVCQCAWFVSWTPEWFFTKLLIYKESLVGPQIAKKKKKKPVIEISFVWTWRFYIYLFTRSATKQKLYPKQQPEHRPSTRLFSSCHKGIKYCPTSQLSGKGGTHENRPRWRISGMLKTNKCANGIVNALEIAKENWRWFHSYMMWLAKYKKIEFEQITSLGVTTTTKTTHRL